MGDLFQFSSSASLEKLTGRKAFNLDGLLELVRTCPDSCIFYHTFSAFRRMREVQVPYNNDFAIWISMKVHEDALAEKLMAIDVAEYNTIESLRARLIEIMEDYRKEQPLVFQKAAEAPFYLCDSVRIVYLTDKFAYNLKSFRDSLQTISVDSLYFHFIESRLQTHLQTDDFSRWMEESLDMPDLAERVRNIDINVYTLEGLRTRLLQVIDEYIGEMDRRS